MGVTALAASILDQNGMIDDLLELFDGDVNLVTRLLNIAMGAAITAKPTYLSADESKVQMFFGNTTCPTSPRASELHQKIGHDLIRCHTNFRHPFNLSWSGKTCDIRRSSKTTS